MKRAQQQCATDVAETVPFEATQVAMQHYSKELEVPEFVEDITQISRSLAKEFSDADGTEESQGPIVFHKNPHKLKVMFSKLVYIEGRGSRSRMTYLMAIAVMLLPVPGQQSADGVEPAHPSTHPESTEIPGGPGDEKGDDEMKKQKEMIEEHVEEEEHVENDQEEKDGGTKDVQEVEERVEIGQDEEDGGKQDVQEVEEGVENDRDEKDVEIVENDQEEKDVQEPEEEEHVEEDDEEKGKEPPLVMRTTQWTLRPKPKRAGRPRGGKGGGKGTKSQPVVIEDEDEQPHASKSKRKQKRQPKAKAANVKKAKAGSKKEEEIPNEEAQDVKIDWGPVTRVGINNFPWSPQPALPQEPEQPSPPVEAPPATEALGGGDTETPRKRRKVDSEVTSFARRPCPKTTPSKERWHVTKCVFDEYLEPLLTHMEWSKTSWEA